MKTLVSLSPNHKGTLHTLPFLKQRTPNTQGGLNERQAQDYRFIDTVTNGLAVAPPGPVQGSGYLSQRAQLHDYPDRVLRDDTNQLHNVRVVKLTHCY